MSKCAVAAYEKVRDILVFIANSTTDVTLRMLVDSVSEASMVNVRILVKQLLAQGYLTDARQGSNNCHIRLRPTQLTLDLYKRKD